MKVVHSPSPSTQKREKINLFENDDPEEVAALCQQICSARIKQDIVKNRRPDASSR